MRKVRGPLWWYRLRYGVSHWTLVAFTVVALFVGYKAEQTYRYSLSAPVCRRAANAPTGAPVPQMSSRGGGRWQPINRCREGWTDTNSHAQSFR